MRRALAVSPREQLAPFQAKARLPEQSEAVLVGVGDELLLAVGYIIEIIDSIGYILGIGHIDAAVNGNRRFFMPIPSELLYARDAATATLPPGYSGVAIFDHQYIGTTSSFGFSILTADMRRLPSSQKSI